MYNFNRQELSFGPQDLLANKQTLFCSTGVNIWVEFDEQICQQLFTQERRICKHVLEFVSSFVLNALCSMLHALCSPIIFRHTFLAEEGKNRLNNPEVIVWTRKNLPLIFSRNKHAITFCSNNINMASWVLLVGVEVLPLLHLCWTIKNHPGEMKPGALKLSA